MIRRGRGLHNWPAGELERRLRAERKAELQGAREFADLIGDTETRDGREYLVLRLDDAYDLEPPRVEPEIRFHRERAQMMRELTRGPSFFPREAA